jgi:hypothetical protein
MMIPGINCGSDETDRGFVAGTSRSIGAWMDTRRPVKVPGHYFKCHRG